jgi:hypothetical protein
VAAASWYEADTCAVFQSRSLWLTGLVFTDEFGEPVNRAKHFATIAVSRDLDFDGACGRARRQAPVLIVQRDDVDILDLLQQVCDSRRARTHIACGAW